MNRIVARLCPAAMLSLVGISFVYAETNFSRLNGFEPRFIPPVNAAYKNIKTDYGAKGDGVTDDTKAFTNALDKGDGGFLIV